MARLAWIERRVLLGLELGADDYVTKPFSVLELMARIKMVLRRAAPESRSIIAWCQQPGKSSSVLCRIPAEGGAIQELGLEAQFLDRVSLHPDGQRLAFTIRNASDSASDVWVLSNFIHR